MASDEKDYTMDCGKHGCRNPAIYSGVVGNLHVIACEQHKAELGPSAHQPHYLRSLNAHRLTPPARA